MRDFAGNPCHFDLTKKRDEILKRPYYTYKGNDTGTKWIADTMTDLRERVEKVERDVGRFDASPLHLNDESSKLGTRNFSMGFDRFRMLFERDSPIFRMLDTRE